MATHGDRLEQYIITGNRTPHASDQAASQQEIKQTLATKPSTTHGSLP